MSTLLKELNEYGLWSILSLMYAIGGTIYAWRGVKNFISGSKRVPNLSIVPNYEHDKTPGLKAPAFLRLSITNHTSNPVVIAKATFYFDQLASCPGVSKEMYRIVFSGGNDYVIIDALKVEKIDIPIHHVDNPKDKVYKLIDEKKCGALKFITVCLSGNFDEKIQSCNIPL